MTRIIATNILSPLGTTTEENFRQVLQMHSMLRLQSVKFQSVEPFCASMFNVVKCFDGYTRFESLCIKSAKDAILKAEIDATSKDTVFVLSSTKGNIELLETGEDTSLLLSAKKIASYFGNPNQPVIVSNACVSGVCAIIAAQRLLESGQLLLNLPLSGQRALAVAIEQFAFLHGNAVKTFRDNGQELVQLLIVLFAKICLRRANYVQKFHYYGKNAVKVSRPFCPAEFL